MKRIIQIILLHLIVSGICTAQGGKPAARLSDPTAHGGSITTGFPTVLIGGKPAARMGDMHTCPMVNPGLPPTPHVGGPITFGSPTVLIGGMPAARMGDPATCAGPPDMIALGCPTVLIGEGGTAVDQDSTGAETAPQPQEAPRMESPHVVEPPKALKSPEFVRSQQIKTPVKKTVKTVVTEGSDKKIVTSGGITIESTGNNVQILAGTSKIIVDPSGGIIIESHKIELKSTGDLNLSAMNITISAEMNAKIKGVNIATEASMDNQMKGTQVNLDGTVTSTIKGGLVKIN